MARRATTQPATDITGYRRKLVDNSIKPCQSGRSATLFPERSVHPQETTTESDQDCVADYFDWEPGQDGCSDVLDLDVDSALEATAAANEDASNAEIAFRHSGWQELRKHVRQVLIAAGATDRRLAAFDACGCNARVWHNKKTGACKIRSFLCHDRLCTPCSKARANIIKMNLRRQITQIQFLHITLTLKSKKSPLSEQAAHARASFCRLRTSKVWKRHIAGGASFFEATWNEQEQMFHPHLHVIVQARFIEHRELKAAWLKASGDSYVVHITPYAKSLNAVEDVGKYASKPLHKSLRQNIDAAAEFVRALQGTRLCNTFGTWRGMQLLKPPEHTDKEDWIPGDRLADILAGVNRNDTAAIAILGNCLKENLWKKPRPPPSG